jgi:hypothetical protein
MNYGQKRLGYGDRRYSICCYPFDAFIRFMVARTNSIKWVLRANLHYLPNTVFKRSVTLAAGLVRIFFSSCPIIKKRPSRALLVT